MRVQVSNKKPEAKRENRLSQTQKTVPSQSIRSPAEQILFLQRTIGNQAVVGMIKSGAFQAKLRISQPDGIYEPQANRVALQVLSMPDAVVVNSIHRAISPEEIKDQTLQAKFLVATSEKPLQRQHEAIGWKGLKKGPNAQEVRVGNKGQQAGENDDGIRRIPLQIDSNKQAIVLIPARLNPANSIDVLLHLHGHNVGYEGASLDTVRDVQNDQIEQQLLASGHNQMIAILPQGSNRSVFQGVNTTTYVASVFTALNNLGIWGKNADEKPILTKTEGHNVILSAHSGGGALLSSLLEQGGKPTNPGGLEGLFLFDSINAMSIPKKNPDGSIAKDENDKPISSGIPDVNNSTELKRIRAFVAYQLDLELTQLGDLAKLGTGIPDANQDQIRHLQLQFLEKSGFRVRGYYTPGWYAQIYAPLVKDIDDWFNKTVATKLPKLDKQVIDRWSKNYVIQSINAVSKVGPVGKGHRGHDYIVGQGIPAGKEGKDYDPAKGGALQDALSSIQPKLTVGAPNDAYELEADRVAEQVMRMPEPACLKGQSPVRPAAPQTAYRHTQVERNWPQLADPQTIQRQGAPAAAVLTDAQQWDQDWTTYAGQQHYFAGTGRPAGTPRQRYDVLCTLYKAHGIPRPMVYMATSITTAKFYHFSTPAHSNLATALAAAESTLKGKGYAVAPVKSVWALNPRTTSAGGWSNHADGKAVDIDPDENPHLISQMERKIITLVSGTEMEKGGQGYDIMKGASEKFKADYNPAGLQRRTTELESAEKAKETERNMARSERDTLKGQRNTLKSERDGLRKQLKSVPTGKKATADDVAKATELKVGIQQKDADLKQVETAIKQKEVDLKKKDAELKGATKDRELIEKQLMTYQATEKAISDLENAVTSLPTEIKSLEDQIIQSKLDEQVERDAKNPKGVQAQQRLRAKLQVALTQKKALFKKKQTQLDAKKKQREADPLRKYAAGGFLNLSKDVVDALIGAGLKWGGNWAGAKDFMHFEL